MSTKFMSFEGLLKRFEEKPGQLAGPKYQRMIKLDHNLRARAFAGQLDSSVEGLYLLTDELQARLHEHFSLRLDGYSPKDGSKETYGVEAFRRTDRFVKTPRGMMVRTTCQEKHQNPSRSLKRERMTKVKGTATNFCLAGGQALAKLTSALSRDCDLFIVDRTNPTNDQVRKNTLRFLRENLEVDEDHMETLLTTHALTIDSYWQFIFRIYTSLTQVLYGFDIGVCGFGYYKGKLYGTGRAIYELINGCIIARPSMSSSSYLTRLIKYVGKGFNVLFPDMIDYSHSYDDELLKISDMFKPNYTDNYDDDDDDDYSHDEADKRYREAKLVVLSEHFYKNCQSDQFASFDDYLEQLKESLDNPSFIDKLYYFTRYYGIAKVLKLSHLYQVGLHNEDYSPLRRENKKCVWKQYASFGKIKSLLADVKFMSVEPYTQADESISFHPERLDPTKWYGRHATLIESN
jgi:hypothetical protein